MIELDRHTQALIAAHGGKLPDHTQLPESDGSIVKNFQEHPQSILLTDAIQPVLQQLHPDGQYCIGQDSGIYWNLPAALSATPVRGAVAPDWFYVPHVPPALAGKRRRSYVLWQEQVIPLLVIEFVSQDGAEERDQTPITGKFWVYEQGIRVPFYAIYEVDPGQVEVYHLVGGRYQRLPANERGHYPIAPLGVELGIWSGVYQNMDLPWLRWWDAAGRLLPTGFERAAQERQRAAQERQRAAQERQRAEQERQRAEQEQQEKERAQQQAEQERQRAKQEQQRAEQEQQRAEQERQRAEQERQEREQAQQQAEQSQQRAEQERQRAERLLAQLRALGIDPEA